MGNNKANCIKKLLKDFEEKCKKLGVKYVIAVNTEIKVHATSLYLASAIWDILKSIPEGHRQTTLKLLIEYLEEEIKEE